MATSTTFPHIHPSQPYTRNLKLKNLSTYALLNLVTPTILPRLHPSRPYTINRKLLICLHRVPEYGHIPLISHHLINPLIWKFSMFKRKVPRPMTPRIRGLFGFSHIQHISHPLPMPSLHMKSETTWSVHTKIPGHSRIWPHPPNIPPPTPT